MKKLKLLAALVLVFLPLLVLAGATFAEEKGAPIHLAQATQTAPAPAEAPAAKIDTGDTAWLLTSSALVLLMTPGLALFYGGMVRRKNVLGTIMHSFVAMGIITIQWVLFGYSLSFGPDIGHFIGNLDWVGLKNVGFEPNADYGPTVPHQAYMIFQMMFAIITPALISGAIAERIKFSTYCVFITVWAFLVYDPLAHWVWGTGGWLKEMGALDFAGGLVVHISSGVSALACVLVLGKRKGYQVEIMAPHNLTLTILGAMPPVVWVVRVQRGQRSSFGCACDFGFCGHTHCNRYRGHVLDGHGMDPQGQTDRSWRRLRCGCRTCCHYAGIRLYWSAPGAPSRDFCRCGLLRSGEPQTEVRL